MCVTDQHTLNNQLHKKYTLNGDHQSMLELLFFMNLTGSLFFVLHMLLFSPGQTRIPPEYRIFLCRLNLMFFIVPFPICLFYIRRYFDSFVSVVPFAPFVYTGTHVIVHLPEYISFALPRVAFPELLVLITWVVVSIRKYKKYATKNRKIREFGNFYKLFLEKEMEEHTIRVSKLVDDAAKELNLKRKPRIQMEKDLKCPHVGGVFRYTLHLPCNWNVPEHVYYIAIKHELAHIKNNDLLFQRISLIARILNWFNPVVSILITRMNKYQELAADARACNGMSKNDRRDFQLAIIDLASQKSDIPDMLAMGLGYKGRFNSFTEERIYTMNNKKLYNHKFVKLAATAVMSVVMFTLSAIPALAYNLPPAVEVDDDVTNPIDTFDINVLPASQSVSLNFEEIDLYSLFENVDFTESKFVCIDETGSISYYNTIDSRIIECPHDYLAARASHHDKNSDGSCTITYYNAKKCAKCGRIVIMEEIGHTTYNKCPH